MSFEIHFCREDIWPEYLAAKIPSESETRTYTPERTCGLTNCDSGEMDVDVYALSCGHVAYYPSAYEDIPGYCPECGAKVVSE